MNDVVKKLTPAAGVDERVVVPARHPMSIRPLIILILLLVFFFIALPTKPLKAEEKLQKYSARVHKIIDGDSFLINNHGKLITIRLYGIDAPEWRQPFSRSAKKFLRKTLINQVVDIQHLYADRYSRSIAIVSFQGRNINQMLVENGLAWVHVYYCHKEICQYWKDLERQARLKRLGL